MTEPQQNKVQQNFMDIDDLVHNSIANALELHLSCTNLSVYI